MPCPHGIAVDATNVYWVNNGAPLHDGSVMRVALSGGTPATLASGQNGAWELAIDANSVYWTNYYGGQVMKMPLSGGTPLTLVSGQGFPGVAVDSTSVYWANDGDGTVMKLTPK